MPLPIGSRCSPCLQHQTGSSPDNIAHGHQKGRPVQVGPPPVLPRVALTISLASAWMVFRCSGPLKLSA